MQEAKLRRFWRWERRGGGINQEVELYVDIGSPAIKNK